MITTFIPSAVKVIHEVRTMLDYAIESSKTLPEGILGDFAEIENKQILIEKSAAANGGSINFTNEEINKLAKIYSSLASVISPATPVSINYTKPSKKMFFIWGMECIPLIRNMWIMSTLFLLGFIISGFYSDNIYSLQANLFFAAGLGAYFYSLYTANKYVVARSFDPTYLSFYYNRIIIGIMAGIILANLINQPQAGEAFKINPPIIALLGGFSSEAVLKILNRLVAMLVTLVQGDTKDLIETKEAELKTKFLQKQSKLKIETASKILPLLNELKSKTDETSFNQIKAEVDKILKEDEPVV